MPGLRTPLRFLRGNYGRLTLTVVALACGVALICALDLVTGGVLRAFVEIVDSMAGRATLQPLYMFCMNHLLKANIQQKPEMIGEVIVK